MVKGMKRLKDIEHNVETDSINMEKYVQEVSKVRWDMFRATGAMFEQEHRRYIIMFAATGNGGNGGGHRTSKGITEHKVINNFGRVSGGKSLFRQWHQRCVNAVRQYDQVHEEIVQHLVTETDLGKDLDTSMVAAYSRGWCRAFAKAFKEFVQEPVDEVRSLFASRRLDNNLQPQRGGSTVCRSCRTWRSD